MRQALHGLSTLASEQGRYAEANARLQQSSAIALEIQYHSGLALDLLELARTAWGMGQAQRTAVLLAAVASLTEGGKIALHTSDDTARDAILAAVRGAMSPQAFAAAWAYGQALSLEQAVALAGDAP